MKLKPEIKGHLEQLDLEKGGGLNPETIKVNTIDSPILLLGLGGTGVDALLMAKKHINKKFIIERTESGVIGDKPPNIEYLAIDTDDNNKRLQFEGIKYSKENNEFILFENNKLTSIYKNRNVAMQESVINWLSENMRLQQIKHGAGGIRQAGRLLLFLNMSNICNVINEKIQKLVKNRNTDSTIYVFILSGISGGTGGGIFIDIAYIVRKLAELKGFKTENIGMIFMPDVTLAENAIDGVAAKNIKANGFASLKELDYLMNLEKNGERFCQCYPDFEINTNEHPYDMCHLISSLDSNGKIISNAKEYCMNVASETIINFIASEEVTAGQNYTISSYLSNIENNKTAFVASLGTKMPVNYTYNIVGISAAELPIEKLVNYLTCQTFKKLDDLYNKNPTKDDVNQIAQKLAIDLHSIEREINSSVPHLRSLSSYTYEVIEKNEDIVEEVCKMDIQRLNEYFELKEQELIEKFEVAIKSNESVLSNCYYDMQKGPFYTAKITSPSFENSLITYINSIRQTELSKRFVSSEELEHLKIKKDIELQKIINKKKAFSFFSPKKSQAEKYKKAAYEYNIMILKNKRNAMIENLYSKFEHILEKYNMEVFDTYKEMLLYIKEQFDKFDNLELYPTNTNGISWELISINDLISIINSISNEPTMDINHYEIIKNLLKDQIINKNKWLDSVNIQIVQNITSVMAEQLEGIISKSLDYYFSKITQLNGDNIEKIVLEKISLLKERSTVMYPIGNIAKGLGLDFPPYSYLAVPTNAPRLKAIASGFTSQSSTSNIKYSNMLNSIYMLNLKIAVPLFCYRELSNYEQEYEQTLNHSSGIHLYESEENNWKDLPSPNYDKLWVNDYENSRELAKNQKIRNYFDKAVEYGFITWDNKKRQFLCAYSDDKTVDEYLDKYEKTDLMLDLSAARKVKLLFVEILNDEERLCYKRYIYDTSYTEEGKADMEHAKGILIYMPELFKKLSEEINRYERMLNIVNKLTVIDEREKEYGNFAQVMYMNEIFKVRRTFKFINDKNETEILYTIEDLTDNFFEYNLYNAYLDLDSKKSTLLKKRASDKESTYSDAEIDQLIKDIEKEISNYKLKSAEISQTYKIMPKGEEKLKFYKTMTEILIKERNVLEY